MLLGSTYLGLGQLVKVLKRLGLHTRGQRLSTAVNLTHVVQDGLHERDRDLRLLDEVVLRVLNLQPRGLLLRLARVLQTDTAQADRDQACVAVTN